MNPYVVRWLGPAREQYDALLRLARSAGKFAEFRYWFQEVGRRLADPRQALNVGSPLAPTALLGASAANFSAAASTSSTSSTPPAGWRRSSESPRLRRVGPDRRGPFAPYTTPMPPAIPPTALLPPLLTADLPGVGGRIKVLPDDFEVEEVPSYLPSGGGEHLYLWIEKRSVGPEHLARTVAQKLGTHVGNVGTAGLKDRHAVTRQWVSVPADTEARLKHLDGDGLKVLKVDRHTNKLKPGHLKGNTFRLLIRDADPARTADAAAIVKRLRDGGMPNYYGPQRFGHGGSTATLGFQCLEGTQPKRLRPFVYKFALSSAQSVLFNDYLSRRCGDDLFRAVLTGDVMMKWPAGGLFVADNGAQEQARFDARELVTGGPMFGTRTFAARGEAAEREQEILTAFSLSPASFAKFGKLMGGTRRHNQVYLDDLATEWTPDGLRVSVTLPSGSYATVLLRELMKVEVNEGPPDEAGEAAEEE